MRRSFAVLTLTLAASLAAAGPAGSGGEEPPPPDGVLVMGVAFQDPEIGAYTREWAVVADPRTGVVRRRRLPGGTLCHGPLLVEGESVVYVGYQGTRAVARALPLSLSGPARTLGPARTGPPDRERALKPPRGMRLGGTVGASSPDGLRLATAVRVRGRTRVAIVDLRRDRWDVVPGAALGRRHSIAWSPSSSWVYFTSGERRLFGYRYGARRAVPLPVDPGSEVLSIATAPAPG